MSGLLDLDVHIEKRGPGRYQAVVDLGVDQLTGYDDDCLGAAGQGETAGEAAELAASKLIALVRGNPEIATALLPLAGPQLAALLIAARYIDAPEVIADLPGDIKRAVRATGRELKKAARKAARTGYGIARLGKKVIGRLKFW